MIPRYFTIFSFAISNSHITPVPISKIPATTKSLTFQFTSRVNCMAIKGISNIAIETKTMIIRFIVFINIILNLPLGCNSNYNSTQLGYRHKKEVRPIVPKLLYLKNIFGSPSEFLLEPNWSITVCFCSLVYKPQSPTSSLVLRHP